MDEYVLIESNDLREKEIHDKLLLLNNILSLHYQKQRTVGWFNKGVIQEILDGVILTAQENAVINQKEYEKILNII